MILLIFHGDPNGNEEMIQTLVKCLNILTSILEILSKKSTNYSFKNIQIKII